MKKIMLGMALVLSGITTNSFALPKTSCDVNVPCFNGGLTFGLAGLYLRPSTSEIDYALVYPTITESTNGSVKSVDPDYDWGYRVNVGYMFPCTGNDVSLTYTNFKSSDKDAVTLTTGQVLFSTLTPFVFGADEFIGTSSNAKTTFEVQAVDLDFGQHLSLGCNTRMRFTGGLRYARLDTQLDVNHIATALFDTDGPMDRLVLNSKQNSRFQGVGPRFGTAIDYNIGHGFNVIGEATGALLIGHVKSDYTEHAVITEGTVVEDDAFAGYKYSEDTRVVPNLTAKLGLGYNFQFNNCSQTKFTIEAGYQVDHYFNATDRLGGVGISQPEMRTRHSIDTSFAGPYVGLQVHI